MATHAPGPRGLLPITPEMLLNAPSGNLFGLTQDAGMGWKWQETGPETVFDPQHPGRCALPTATPSPSATTPAIGKSACSCRAAAKELHALGGIPFAGFCSDPCDGRTQGTVGMFDSLPYRNDAATIFRRLIRSLPPRERRHRHGHLRQRAARHDDGPGGYRRSAVRPRPRRRHPSPTMAKMPARCKRSGPAIRTV